MWKNLEELLDLTVKGINMHTPGTLTTLVQGIRIPYKQL